MKLWNNKHISLIITTKPITKEHREALKQGIAHFHRNPKRTPPLIKLIEAADKEGRTYEEPNDVDIHARVIAEAASGDMGCGV